MAWLIQPVHLAGALWVTPINILLQVEKAQSSTGGNMPPAALSGTLAMCYGIWNMKYGILNTSHHRHKCEFKICAGSWWLLPHRTTHPNQPQGFVKPNLLHKQRSGMVLQMEHANRPDVHTLHAAKAVLYRSDLFPSGN